MFEQELNSYWKTVVDTIQDGIMIVDKGGTIISVNRAMIEMTGYERDEIVGKPCTVLNCNTCEVALERKGEHWCVLFKTGAMKGRRCTFTRKDRRPVHVLKNASLLRDRDGQILGAVETMTDISELVEKDIQIEAFRRDLLRAEAFHGIIGSSPAMQRVFDLIANTGGTDAPVIIFGESGTGKELVARAIHEVAAGRERPFIKVNCAALNESLLESELFGHVKGAFTGAYRSREGRFEAARGGDIFLDEIGDLPLATQVKLLRVLEEKVIERVGDNRSIPVDVRVISATNRDLADLVRRGEFREDLYYRINVIPVQVPPLRERVEDIPVLADFFFRRIQLKSGKKIEGISRTAMDRLMTCSWPGNVRELKSAFEYAFVACRASEIQPHHFPPTIAAAEKERTPQQEKRTRELSGESKEETEKRRLVAALEQSGGNRSEAARILGVSRVTVWNRMKKYGIRLRQELEE